MALQALCSTLHFPSAAVRVDGVLVAAVGELRDDPFGLALQSGPQPVGELLVGRRAGEHRLSALDKRILELLASLLAVAVHANALAEDLRESQATLVTARDKERARLRRDLHDGLGPQLTGVILKVGAARRLVHADPQRSEVLLNDLEGDTTAAISDIRRLVDELRPVPLDELGLVAALQRYVDSVPSISTGVQLNIEADQPIGPLPAGVEVAAYRIATESLTNVLRHAQASLATLHIGIREGELSMEDPRQRSAPRSRGLAGVGLTSMRERTAMLGGRFHAGPGPAGGQVKITLPLATT